MSSRLGSDLPWWGGKYFGTQEGYRVMIVTQDSLSLDAGSIAFHAHLMSNGLNIGIYFTIYPIHYKKE